MQALTNDLREMQQRIKIRLKDGKLYNLREDQMQELQKWRRGVRYDTEWLKVDNNAPTGFVGLDGRFSPFRIVPNNHRLNTRAPDNRPTAKNTRGTLFKHFGGTF